MTLQGGDVGGRGLVEGPWVIMGTQYSCVNLQGGGVEIETWGRSLGRHWHTVLLM